MSIFTDQESEVAIYGKLLQWSTYFGLALLLLTFIIYIAGLTEPYIPLSELDDFWVLSVREYTETTGIETGWAWLGMLRYADFLNFLGIAFLAGVTVFCYIAIIPVLLRDERTIYAALAIVQVIVLALAASGIVGVGHT